MNRRILGIFLFTTALISIITGIIMFLMPYNIYFASIHTSFGFAIIVFVILHLINNRKPLIRYVTAKGESFFKKLQGIGIILGIILISLLMFFDFSYINSLYHFGNQLRNKQQGKVERTLDYEFIDLNKKESEYNFEIELKKGKSYEYPLIAVWIEDSLGNYMQTIYISKTIGSGTYRMAKEVGNRWVSGKVRRPEALPRWSHQRGINAEDGLFVPLYNSIDLDGVTGATPGSNFIISTGTSISLPSEYKICFEINESFDWNEYYSKNSFPDDTIYSGPGNVGQPALVYSTEISKLDKQKYFLMKLEGHSHYSGKNGKINTNLDSLTTALDIVDRILVRVEKNEL